MLLGTSRHREMDAGRQQMVEAGEDVVRRLQDRIDEIEGDLRLLRGDHRFSPRRAGFCAGIAAAAGAAGGLLAVGTFT